MSVTDLVFILAIAAAAYYFGYQMGRASVLRADRVPDEGPLPGAHGGPLPGPSDDLRSREPRPPPAAGDEPGHPGDRSSTRPRRATRPPPAAAGLLDKGSGTGKPGASRGG